MHKGKFKFKSGMCLIYKNSQSVATILSESLKCLILVAGNLDRPMLLRLYYRDWKTFYRYLPAVVQSQLLRDGIVKIHAISAIRFTSVND